MEGDTELGLLMKNTMGAMGPILPEWKWATPVDALAKVKSALKA